MALCCERQLVVAKKATQCWVAFERCVTGLKSFALNFTFSTSSRNAVALADVANGVFEVRFDQFLSGAFRRVEIDTTLFKLMEGGAQTLAVDSSGRAAIDIGSVAILTNEFVGIFFEHCSHDRSAVSAIVVILCVRNEKDDAFDFSGAMESFYKNAINVDSFAVIFSGLLL